MGYGALFLVLIFAAGYIYCWVTPKNRYKILRMDGYSLYFYIGVYGVFICLLAVSIIAVLDIFNVPSKIFPSWVSYVKNLPETTLIASSLVKSSLLSLSVVLIVYIFSLIKKIISTCTIKRKYRLALSIALTSDYEYILYESTSKYRSILITLESGKVYVGIVYNFDPMDGKAEFITIMPLLSGYRDKCQEVKFTTNYHEHYKSELGHLAAKMDNPETIRLMKGYVIIIPAAQIVSISRFDINAYRKFMKSKFNSDSYAYSIKSGYDFLPDNKFAYPNEKFQF
ncbi:hypothetical protein Q3O60_13550 [Alkalimonas collagenimarina]|uniref:Uncharacterized protein n=1 Tax=Alkalimonas collagenimarina TaxID=400390 RepID=A0ABT9H1P1_9GAMM|nr:hypothetical protein [Alkalimonas collagenimarina]MDP4537212.1 hypothetical protein [Alkalimonas collagenimarina]